MRGCSVAIAFPTGPCFGVNRALDITERILENEDRVYMLHPLIHNPRVVDELEKKGVVVSPPDDIPRGALVILSAHGTPIDVKEKLLQKEAQVVDAVCPLVEYLHRSALALIEEGRFLIVVADKNHQETKALVSKLPGDKFAFYGEWEKIPKDMPLGVVFQTTFEYARVPEILASLYRFSNDIRIINTICPATRGRQGVIDRVGKDYDCIVVVGGKISANTGRLYEKAKRYARSLWIEKPEEIPEDICRMCQNVLIVGGASTPIEQLIEVYLHLKKVIQ